MTSPKITVREGKEEDCDVVAQFLQALADHDQHSYVANDINELKRDGFGERQWFRTFIAEVEQDNGEATAVGMVLYLFSFSMLAGRCVHLESLYVNETMRGRGLGTTLIKEVAKVAVANHCRAIDIPAMGANGNAIKLYKSLGAADATEEHNVHLLSIKEPQLTTFANS